MQIMEIYPSSIGLLSQTFIICPFRLYSDFDDLPRQSCDLWKTESWCAYCRPKTQDRNNSIGVRVAFSLVWGICWLIRNRHANIYLPTYTCKISRGATLWSGVWYALSRPLMNMMCVFKRQIYWTDLKNIIKKTFWTYSKRRFICSIG